MSSGHMPNSISLPFATLLESKDGVETLLPKEKLEKVFIDAVGQDKWELIKQGKLVSNKASVMVDARARWLLTGVGCLPRRV